MSEIEVIVDEIMFQIDKLNTNRWYLPEIKDENADLLMIVCNLPVKTSLEPEDWKVSYMKLIFKTIPRDIQGNTFYVLYYFFSFRRPECVYTREELLLFANH